MTPVFGGSDCSVGRKSSNWVIKVKLCWGSTATGTRLRGEAKTGDGKEEKVEVYSLGDFPFDRVDMLTLILVGNRSTFVEDRFVVTPRGY